MSSHTLDQKMSVASIVPSKDNARVIDTKSASFIELKESIKASGVQIPIHVWPHPDKKKPGKYEIRCGERRWLASRVLKLKTIPAVIHRGISYEVAMLLTITENKFHQDLAPLEEVEEVARCMDHLRDDARLIADLIGQTEQWVRLRANIHRNLSKEWRRAFLEMARHPHFANWSIGHLTLIARLPADAQAAFLRGIESQPWRWEAVSVKDLDGRLSEALMLLIKAKWNLDDEKLLPTAGACSDCKKRSGAEPVLWFGPLEDQIDRKDRCLDTRCWNNKMTLFLQQRAKFFGDKYSNLAYQSTEHLSANEKEDLSKKFGRVYDPEDVQKSTKGSKDAVPALVVSGTGAGSITFIREKKFRSPGGGGVKRKGQVTPLKERRANLKGKRWAQVLLELIEKVESTGVDKLIFKDKIAGVMALAAFYGNCMLNPVKESRERIDQLVKTGAKGGREKALVLLWDSVKPTLVQMLAYGGPVSQLSGHYVKTARWVAMLIQVDVDKLFQEVSKKKGFKVPKSWASLNEDGSQKKAVKKPKVVKAKAGKTVKVDFRPNAKSKKK